jgi:2-dehydro-3-deoxyphosphooctonate aldolase (KDO 8-P synthase)
MAPTRGPLKKMKALLEVLAEIDRSVKKAGFIELS